MVDQQQRALHPCDAPYWLDLHTHQPVLIANRGVVATLERVDGEQDYCDWCYGPVESEDRKRSRELGLVGESSFACRNCIVAHRVYSPPDGWEGEPDDWPVPGIGDQLELVKANVETVLRDVERTTDLRPNVTVDSYMSIVMIAYGRSSTTPSVLAIANPEALAETADYLQDHIVEDLWSPWPVCPLHDVGVYSEVRDGTAVWWCRVGAHLVAPVGLLGTTNP